MKKQITFLTCLLIYSLTNAQIGINTANPDPSSALDITSDNKGFLLPRIALNSLTQQLTTSANATSLLIYNTGSSTVPKGFYTWDGVSWIQLIDKTTAEESAYWAPQAANLPKNTDSKNSLDNSAEPSAITVDIFQKGKVGIGYSGPYQIDFNVNKSQKQLDIGGDFRTSYYNPTSSSYYGIETNSVALPFNYATRGNVLYNAQTKNLEDYSFFNRPYNGSMFIQSKDNILFLSRTGVQTTTEGAYAHEVEYTSKKSVEIIYSRSSNESNNKIAIKSFNSDNYSIYDDLNHDSQFGQDFNVKKFYLGDKEKTAFYFPNTRPLTASPTPVEKDNQILKYNKATSSLEWSDNVSAPKYFYMPSILLPTTSNDGLIGAGSTANYTYDSATQTFSTKIHTLFSNQFTTPIASSSSGSSNLSEFVKLATDYDYYVTAADANVFTNISINASGILTYKINPNAIVRNGSFMNIVLKVK